MVDESTSNSPYSTQVPTGVTDSNIHMVDESTSNSPYSTQVPTGITDSNIHMVDGLITNLPPTSKIVPTGITDQFIHMVDGSSKYSSLPLTSNFPDITEISILSDQSNFLVKGYTDSKNTPASPSYRAAILNGRRKRFISCHVCCRGDLCNDLCSPNSPLTPTPAYFTISPPSNPTSSTDHQTTSATLISTLTRSTPTTSNPTTPSPTPTTSNPSTHTPARTTSNPTTPSPTRTTSNPTTHMPARTTSNPTTPSPIRTTSNPTTQSPTRTTSNPTTPSRTRTTSNPTTPSPTRTTSNPTTHPTTTTSRTTTTKPTAFPVTYTGLSGSEFLLALSKHKNLQNADNVSMVITSPNNGMISVYFENTKSFINTTLTKGRNIISLDPSTATSVPWNEQKGIYVKSNVNISVHVMEYRNGSDTAFSVIPVPDLSNRYVAASAKGTKDSPSFITVVALHNDTKVRFNLRLEDKNRYVYISPWRNYRYENGESFNITLNQYETFQLEVNGTDLTGTVIDSSKPVAVFSGAKSTVIPSTVCTQDCETQKVIQMIPPTDALGTDFIIPKLQNRQTFTYKIIASEDRTQVAVNGKIVNLPTAGSFKEFETMTNKSICISSNKPILVLQMTEDMKPVKENASGAMLVTPAIQQFKSDYHFSVSDDGEYKHFISIITKKGQEGGLVLDDKPFNQINATLETIALNGSPYVVINIPLSQLHSHDVENLQGHPFGLMAYGFKHNQGYGYPVGLKLTHYHYFCISSSVLSLMCLSCRGSIQPRHCHSITYCAEDEVCIEQNQTLHIHGSDDGNLRPPTCTECCDTDLCNAKGCTEPGYPPLSSRGPVCLACTQHFDSQECRQIAHCRDSELCFIKEESEFGDKVYSSGCMPFQQCISIVSNNHAVVDLSNMHHHTYSTTRKATTHLPTSRTTRTTRLPTTRTTRTTRLPTTRITRTKTQITPGTTRAMTTILPPWSPSPKPILSTTTDADPVPIVGKRDNNRHKRFTSCEHCCRGDLCNDVCVHYNRSHPPHVMIDLVSILLLLSAELSQGLALMCLQCVNVIQPRHCHGITYCAENEVCFVEKVASSDGIRYNSGCMLNDVCVRQNSTGSITAYTNGLMQTITCTECCNSNLCNSKGCGEPGFPVNRGPVCLGCTQIRNASDCQTITYCRESEVCHITEVYEFGDRIFSTGCIHSQLCSTIAPRPYAMFELSSWHNFTRPAISTVPTTSSHHVITTNTTRVQSHTHHTRPTHKHSVTAPIGVVVVGRRSVQRRSVDCNQCCSGDLCNYECDKGGSTQPSGENPSPSSASSSATTEPVTSPLIFSTQSSVISLTTPSQKPINIQSTTGKEFLLAFSKHENGNDADNITLLFTSNQNGHLSIFLPGNNAYINTTITKGDNLIELDPHITLNGLQKENKSVHIVTDVNVTLQVQEYRNVFDTGYLALPSHCLSNKYIVSTESAFDGANPSYVTVAALRNNTEISFTLSISENDTIDYNGKGYGNGDTINVTLDQYQTFQLASVTDFTGTVVQSSEPVSVLSGNTATVVPKPSDSSKIFDAQTLTQMIPPVKFLGQNFIIPKLQDRHSFYYKIIASSPNTHVAVDNKYITLPKEGAFQVFESFHGRSVNVSSDKPILVVQVPKTMQSHFDTASGAMIITPSVEQFKSEYAVIVPDPPKRNLQTQYRSYISIMTESKDVDNILIDGRKYDTYNSNLQTVHLKDKVYSVITMEMDIPGLHEIKSVSGNPFGLITYGFDFAQGYGYPVGLKC
ncbi:uncharacterized protein LOC134240877 [Saccostrea cucullata]|uniref:uncharacterized protein LOC134240877 n=1 Tax=Saccostrea cuccullata TaxID=36930 RepID=UPI002ED2FEFB